MKTISFLLMLIAASSVAQTNKCDSLFDAEAGVDVMSSYVWRGIRYVTSPAVQPCMEVSFKNVSVGAWSSWHFFSGWSEIDLYAGYENDYVMFGVMDYYSASNYILDDYFNYHSGASGHMLEAYAGFPGNDKIPFSFLAATTFFGDSDDDDNPYYSTFLEVSYLFTLKNFDSELRLGFTPAEGMYADKTSICEAAFRMEREIELLKERIKDKDIIIKLLKKNQKL
ncbi:MAG: hypothetical protein EOM23_07445 [Candidatus Moranbacteria bacterium]|nr:hypothetical protein [Candidatus Moranbacteria bacterium]